MAARPDRPTWGFTYSFTEEELLRAFRLLLPEHDARELATDAAAAILRRETMTFSEETLVLLSLVGPESAAEVERYRTWRRQGLPATAEEESAWKAMTDEIETHRSST